MRFHVLQVDLRGLPRLDATRFHFRFEPGTGFADMAPRPHLKVLHDVLTETARERTSPGIFGRDGRDALIQLGELQTEEAELPAEADLRRKPTSRRWKRSKSLGAKRAAVGSIMN